MRNYFSHICILIFAFCFASLQSQNELRIVKGKVISFETKKEIEGVSVRLSTQLYWTTTNKKGEFSLTIPTKENSKLIFTHLSYQSFTKDVKENDSLFVFIELHLKFNPLDTVSIIANHQPETLIWKPNYSIFDFDFYEDKLLLLTSENSLSTAQIQLSSYDGKVISSYKLPKQAGDAKYFFHDYEGYTEVICKDSVFRLDVLNTQLMIMPIKQTDFNRYLKPISDTVQGNYYFNNQWEKYPAFNYYYLHSKDSLAHLLQSISNADLLKLYNFEYYYLSPPAQLEARRMADHYKTDVHVIAALMSGFTKSLFYEALYAPLFILNDTICIFNHHNNFLYHYTKQNKLIDSVKISYHHPKNWREWKRQLFVDESENKVYAFFSKDGHHYLKQINFQSGKEVMTYKLKHHSAERIKIKDGYAYYVYRPFGSTQERFLYREKIEQQ